MLFCNGFTHESIQVEEIVMCLWCCWKDLDDSNLIRFMLLDLNLGCGWYAIFNDVNKLSSCYLIMGSHLQV